MPRLTYAPHERITSCRMAFHFKIWQPRHKHQTHYTSVLPVVPTEVKQYNHVAAVAMNMHAIDHTPTDTGKASTVTGQEER